MFDVLTFVYENYDPGQSCPEPAHLQRKLAAVGFEADEIGQALDWLQGLEGAAHPSALQPWLIQPQSDSMRIYPRHEQVHLGSQALGFLAFLELAKQLPAPLREVVVERAMAAPGAPIALEDLKTIVLLVCWRFGHEPDPMLLDALCDSSPQRLLH